MYILCNIPLMWDSRKNRFIQNWMLLVDEYSEAGEFLSQGQSK